MSRVPSGPIQSCCRGGDDEPEISDPDPGAGRVGGLWPALRRRRLTTDFLGGIFTLDGIHPTNTGHAVIANEFIRALNQGFDAGIRPFSVGEIAHIMHADPLVLPGVRHSPLADPVSALEILRGLDFIRNGT